MTGPTPAPRVGCVSLPHVAIALEERDNTALTGRPLAIEAPQPGPRTVHDLSYTAHLAGVARGMAVAQARQLCPDLTVLPARPDDYRDTFQLLLALLGEYTNDVEPADLEHSWLSTVGLLPAGPGSGASERTMVEDLAARVRRDVGLVARVGLAHGKLTSRIVTQYLEQRDTMVLPAGREVSFLGGLAVRYLPLAPPKVQHLSALGISKVHQYAALPSPGILPRFGHEGLRAYHLAHGQDDGRVRPWTAEPFLEAEHVFLEPIVNLRSVSYHIEQLATQIARPLAAQFTMAGALALSITFEDGRVTKLERTLVQPVASPGALQVHAEALMTQVSWGKPVERIGLAVRGLCPTVGRQLALFRQEHEDRDGLDAAVRRIQGKYGADVALQGHPLEPDSPLHERRAYVRPWNAA